ncbi:hypothetical protein KY290_024134 [Solanum tuberosum]|uniref:Carboxypeptidase A inhibitor-like domain-containing protein n=1 Tax=Solanum tuberosum TaxID=4113 RepID=A0ABQ7URK6_SOLTU|nr:hypothetical protein KY285_022906 [Solanum tuberosum]KAH0753864.1 hypothetical protein KY290_024134 [Solanum tuberosum]
MAAVNKFVIVVVLLFAMTIVETSNMQVMALRDLQINAERTIMKMKLFPDINILGACSNPCKTNSDCSGGFTLCQWCWEKSTFTGRKYKECGVLP